MQKRSYSLRENCFGKVKHRSYMAALTHIRRRTKIKRPQNRLALEKSSGKVEVYKCESIHPFPHWHTGKIVERQPKPYKRKRDFF